MELHTVQKEFKELLKNIQHPRLGAVLGLYEEIGELAKVLMNWEMYGERNRDNLREECADTFFSLLDVCNAYEIDLDAACTAKFNDTKSKISKWELKYGDRLRVLREKLDTHVSS